MSEELKPDDIPQEVWDAADAVSGAIGDQLTAVIFGGLESIDGAVKITEAISRLLMADRARRPTTSPVNTSAEGVNSGGSEQALTENPQSLDDLTPAEMLIQCAALLEVFSENADERDDGAEWAMASVMAKHARTVAEKAFALRESEHGGEGWRDALELIAAFKGKTLISVEHGRPYSIGANDAFEQAADIAATALLPKQGR